MFTKEWFSCFKVHYSFLQKREIQKGIENGLERSEIALFADAAYNFAQMKEIRLAMEHHVDPKTRGVMLNPCLDADQMRSIRYRLERGEIVKVPQYQWRKWITLASEIVVLMIVSFVTFQPDIPTALVLKQDMAVVEVGETFHPEYYLDSYSGRNGELFLPGEIDTSTPGVKAAVYRLKTEQTELTRILWVNVQKESV